MAEIRFDTGLVSYDINGKATVCFNPTDSAFVEKLFRTFDTLDQKQEAYKAEINGLADQRAIFGGMNVYAIADGLPVWCNLMLAIIDEIDTSFAREQKKTNPRLAKYAAKYQKK